MSAAATRPAHLLAEEAIQHGAMQKPGELAPLLKAVKKLRPEVVVEIGTCKGGTLWAWTQVAHPLALIVSIDLPGGPYGGGSNQRELAKLKAYGRMEQQLEFIRADSHAPATFENLVSVLKGRRVDFLFIDGDHTFKGALGDWLTYSPLVRPGGLVAFHDILEHRGIPASVGPVGVHQVWADVKETMGPRGHKTRELCVPGDDRLQWGGIGLIHV